MEKLLLILNILLLAVGVCGGPLIMRLYFVRGGKRIWLSSWLESGGWPVILIPFLVSCIRRRMTTAAKTDIFSIKPRLFLASAVIGVFTGVDNYLYAYGVAKLPVSTSSLIIATQLVFTAVFAFIIVKQKFTPYSINSVVLLTVGSVVLGLHSSGDRPEGESSKEYITGFFMTVAAAALYGLILPLVELMYMKSDQALTYTLVLEIQMVMCFFATLFCTVGMVINNDFQVIPREAREYELGETKYYVVLCFSAIIWQCFFLGVIGVIYFSSSILSGVVISALLPITELLAIIFYHERFQADKGVSLFLSLWGFLSYFLGEFRKSKKKQRQSTAETEITTARSETIPAP